MVELHSNTLELFAADPRVLALFARHRGTGEPLPPGLLHAAQRARRRFAGLELQCQLQYCLIDQLLHGPQPPTGAAAERAIAGLMEEHSALGWHPGCHPHIR
jgi:Zn-dependent oligopeptidase